MPRPRILGHAQRREACELLAAGFPAGEVGRLVGCSARTIRRELARNAGFRRELRDAEHAATFEPLEHLRRQARRSWRAAAWLLERGDPQMFAPRRPAPCRPAELQIACDRLIEAALQDATDDDHRRRLFRRLQDVADQVCQELLGGALRRSDALRRQATPLVDGQRLSKEIDDSAAQFQAELRRSDVDNRTPWDAKGQNRTKPANSPPKNVADETTLNVGKPAEASRERRRA